MSNRKKIKPGWVYLLAGEGIAEGLYKVGLTRNDPDKRATQVASGCPFNLHLAYAFRANDPEKWESDIHAHLARYRVRGEWFTPSQDLLVALLNFFNSWDGSEVAA